jgi:sterol 3beta-glucosyltransferase
MKILLISIGSRGDIEPFLALGELLKKHHHEVWGMFPEQFRHLAKDADIPFISLGTAFIELIDSPDGKQIMGGSSILKNMGAYLRLYKKSMVISKASAQLQYATIAKLKPDRILYNGKATYPTVWGMRHPGKAILISPVPGLIHPVKEYPNVGIQANLGPFFNKFSYGLANYGLAQNIASTTRNLDAEFSTKQIRTYLKKMKLIFTLSPTLVQRPTYWPPNAQILGYHERVKTNNWQPNEALKNFISTHKKLLFISFGSMLNRNPFEKTSLMLKVLKKQNIAAIINTSSGGLPEPEIYDRSLFHFVSDIPYGWVFPKVYAVVHHGGSGTTHMTLKNGCASLIIPHIVDQFLWNKICSRLGVGPLGVAIEKLNHSNFERLITHLYQNETYKVKAKEIAQNMQNEQVLEDVLHKTIVA